jgi:hypothetical protein
MKRFSTLLCLTVVASTSFKAWGDTLPANIYPSLRQGDQLLPCVSPYLGKDIKLSPIFLDADLLKRRNNFGYSDEEIKKYFSVPVNMTLDSTGLDRTFFKPPPAPGVHPRIFFNPEDLPALRDRLSNTGAGKAVMNDIRDHVTKTLTGDKATYAADYAKLANGDLTVDFFTSDRDNIVYTLMYEAFRCLVDDDKVGGQKVAAALTTIAQVESQRLDANIAKETAKGDKGAPNDWRNVGQGPGQEGTIGIDYDFAYNWMTDAQRQTVREFLVKDSAGMTNLGCETLHALHSGSSNWISWSNRLIFVVTAIEGEPGYDASTYRRCEAAQTNFINSMFPTGEAYEGWGKNFMFIEHMITMAKRGNDLIANTNIRAVYNDYFLNALNPWGTSFTFCDSLGGSGCKVARNADVMMYHTLFPNDTAGDFILRNQIDGDYSHLTGGRVNTQHPFSVMDSLCCAMFASDLNPSTDWDKELAQVTQGRSLTYFSQDTCNMATRSSWDKDALYLNYLTRAIPGGHVYCDRSHFSLYGLGRFWSIYHVMRQIHDQYSPANRSVLLADDEGPSIVEGKCVNFTDQPQATFTATDLTPCWDYQNKELVNPPAGVTTGSLPFSFNDFRLHPSELPWMGMPLPDLPNWYTSEKPPANDGERISWYKRPVQVVKAFRTAGLVRGAHPYALIVDDLQKDDQPHNYDWGMILADDLTMGSAKSNGDAAHPQADIVLDENIKADPKAAAGSPPPANDRHLLVRVLQASQLNMDQPASVAILSVLNPPQKNMQLNKLHIPSQSVSPDFKMLLFPYKSGQELPSTTWSADHRTVTVAWKDQSDQITFSPGNDGRTRLKIVRNQNELINVE